MDLKDGLQSLPQWEKAFNNPSGGKVFVLLRTRQGLVLRTYL